MSKIPILVALLWLSVMSSLSAQGSFTTTSGASVRISGAAYLKLHNTQWDNNGTFTAGGSTLEFSGNQPAGAFVAGFTPDVFKNLRINRSTGTTTLLKNVVVTGSLSFSAGLFNLNGFNITLPQPGSALAGESETSRTFSSSTGEIQLIVNLNAPASVNPGNLGATITSAANLGNTIFRRGHLPFIGACNESIQRYFFIQPTNNTGLNATLRLYYFDAELNGVPENELILYRSNNGGASWTAVGFDTRNTTQNWVEKSGLSSLSMFTLADANWLSTKTWYLDTDTDNYYTGTGITQCASPGDGYRYAGLTGGGDCDDTNAAINPGATEITCNNVDENCNGMADDTDPVVDGPVWYADSDGDGYGNAAAPVTACTQPMGYVPNAGDCDDGNATTYPGATELCNNLDDDCDGATDEASGWNNDPAANNLLTNNSGANAYAISDGAGGMIVVWEEGYFGDNSLDVYAQRIDAAGNVLWGANGLAVCAAAQNQRLPKVASDGDGGAIVVWVDARNADNIYDIYAQRISGDGAALWTPQGVPVCVMPGYQGQPDVCTDGNGGAYIIWEDQRPSVGTQIFGQRLDANGNSLWVSNGLALTSGACGHRLDRMGEIIPDGSGNALVSFLRSACTSGYGGLVQVIVQKVSPAGSVLWAALVYNPPVPIAAFELWNIYNVKMVPDATGGAIVSFFAHTGNAPSSNIYGQRVDANGALQWGAVSQPVTVCSTPAYENSVAADGLGGIIVAWSDTRNGGNGQVYAQKVNSSGTVQWPIDGILVADNKIIGQCPISLVPNGAGGGLLLITSNWVPTLGYGMLVQQIGNDGDLLWGADGLMVASPGSSLSWNHLGIVNDGNCEAIVGFRRGGMYAAKVTCAGTLEGGAPLWYADSDNDSYGDPAVSQYAVCQPAGFVAAAGDCNDNDVAVHAPQQYYVDADADGYGSATTAMLCSAIAPSGYSTNNSDCDDTNAALNPSTVWLLDADNDNYYTGAGIAQCASPGEGYRYAGLTGGGDCDDSDAAINPGAAETYCNDVDENCNGMADDDPEAPVISGCPVGNQILNTNGNSSCELTIPTAAALGIMATDNCVSLLPPINQSISFFTGTADGGTFAVDYTVTDGNGNTSTCTVTFEVNDDDAPVISNCPTNILLKTGDDGGADCEVQVTYTPPTFSDNCDGTGTATWASGPMSGASLNVVGSPYTVVYTKTDLAGNAVATDCSFTVTVQDDTKPTLACPSSNTQTPLSGNCTYTLSGTAYDPTGLSDNCGVAGVSNDFNNLATLAGAVLPTGANLIKWTVTDVNGLIHTCQFTLTVTACVEISGTIFWKGDGVAGVNNANMALSVEASNTDATDLNGDFDLVANTGDDFVITPSKNTGSMLNGLTAADATVIQRHLTGNELITDFYRLIAADCNRSNNISSVDAALIRQALLGNPSSLNILNAAGHWRFLRTDYVPVLAGPYTLDHYSLYNKRVLTGVSGMLLAQDFYGVKAGDVFEESNPGVDVADPTLKPDPDAKPLVWRVRDRLLKTGQTIELDFSVANFTDIAAFQYGMRFDPTVLQYQQASGTSTIVPLDEASNFGTWQIAKGELRTLWSVNEGKSLPGVQPMYRLQFKVLQGGKKLSEVLGLDPAILAALAYTSQLAQREMQLVFTDYVQHGLNIPDVLAGDYFDLLQNRPNPFSDRTTIGFILPEAVDAQLRVLDISGRELWRVDKTYPAGYHEEVIRLEEIGSTGMLFYELNTPQGKQTRKMLAVQL